MVAIEKGERRPSSSELVQLAKVLNTEVSDLVREGIVDAAVSPRFRKTDRDRDAAYIEHAVERLRRLGARYVELERMHGLHRAKAPLETLQTYYIGDNIHGDPKIEGEDAARTVRGVLGLGDGPATNIDERLESEAGLRIFYLDQIPPSLSAFFIWSDEFGACVGVNAAHPRERQRWSLLHEFGHFLRDREAGDILEQDTPLKQKHEIFPEAFAKEFLLPAMGIKKRFQERCRSGKFTPVDIYNMSRVFQVSFQAMALRLEDLRLLRKGTYDKIRESGIRTTTLAEHGSEAEPSLEERERSRLPELFVELSVSAYEQSLLSEKEFADFLELTISDARELYQKRRVIELDDSVQIMVDYSAGDLRDR